MDWCLRWNGIYPSHGFWRRAREIARLRFGILVTSLCEAKVEGEEEWGVKGVEGEGMRIMVRVPQ